MTTPVYYVGLMSGTSLDGIDAVVAQFEATSPCRVLHSLYCPYDDALRQRLLALHEPDLDDLGNAALTGIELAKRYARTVNDLIGTAGIDPQYVRAMGCHGQTVRHRPELGYTLQLVNPALLAELTGITVVTDFRSRDIAAGGQGAPLVPAFHAAVFGQQQKHRVIVNIGGISNLTDLPPAGEVIGFDCGPGNMLMDAWVARHRRSPFDEDGRWAASGQVLPDLLDKCLAHPFFARQPPKSTGREAFNLSWLETLLTGREAAADVQATLLMLTATTIADAVRGHCAGAEEVFLCGGGARNAALVHALRSLLPGVAVEPTDQLGIPGNWVEAAAFAWLAKQTLDGKPGNLPAVTGAKGPRILGAIYPA